MADKSSTPIQDSDTDAFHILPLSIVPVQTPALRRARLIKNVRLATVLELFHGEDTGSGQIAISDLDAAFSWPTDRPNGDRDLMRKLASIPSYDVYSLRILLRERGIPVSDSQALQLSESMRIRLDRFMTAFTRPLIQEIYGEKDVAAGGMGDVVSLFRDPDVRKVRERLRRLAEMLEIDVPDVPRFLEDYGDIFLSLSYYRERLEELEPVISGFLDSLDSLRENYQLRANAGFLVSCQRIQATFNEMLAAIGGRFENFDRSTLSLWQDLTAERFRVVENLIKGYHTTIGGALCVLGVKMDAWARLFPDPMTGGPIRRSEFIMSEMKQGLEGIRRIENSVPMLSALEKEGRTRAQGKTVPAGSA